MQVAGREDPRGTAESVKLSKMDGAQSDLCPQHGPRAQQLNT